MVIVRGIYLITWFNCAQIRVSAFLTSLLRNVSFHATGKPGHPHTQGNRKWEEFLTSCGMVGDVGDSAIPIEARQYASRPDYPHDRHREISKLTFSSNFQPSHIKYSMWMDIAVGLRHRYDCCRIIRSWLCSFDYCGKHDTNGYALSINNYSIWIFTHLKLCLADAIHNFKWVKIIQIWQNGVQLFLHLLVDVTLNLYL